MDPFLELLHSVSAGLSNTELAELKFLCRERVSKRKLERVQSGLDLFSVLLEQSELGSDRPELLRELLISLRRHDLLQRLDNFETSAGAAAADPDLRPAFDIICDNVGKDWRRLARQLKISDAKIDAIEERYPRNLMEQVRESLKTWKTAQREDATVAQLMAALRACRLNLVADLLEEEQAGRLKNGSGPMSPMSWNSNVSASSQVGNEGDSSERRELSRVPIPESAFQPHSTCSRSPAAVEARQSVFSTDRSSGAERANERICKATPRLPACSRPRVSVCRLPVPADHGRTLGRGWSRIRRVTHAHKKP
ncbi:FAS-associated death domain protein [Rhynchocyon petersi]